MSNFKHFTLNERITIEHMLKDSFSFKAIGRELNRDCTSISKEIRKHIIYKKKGSFGRSFNNCINRFTCTKSYICDSALCRNRYCWFCSRCSSVCEDFKKEDCALLTKPPYVCNGCSKLQNCTLLKSSYIAEDAQKEYELTRSESRSRITVDEDEISRLDGIISPLIRKG